MSLCNKLVGLVMNFDECSIYLSKMEYICEEIDKASDFPSLNDEQVKSLGSLLWCNRDLFFEKNLRAGECSALMKVGDILCRLRPKIQSSDSKAAKFVIDLITRFFPSELPKLPNEMLSYIVAHMDTTSALKTVKATETANSTWAARLLADVINKQTVKFSCLPKFPNLLKDTLAQLKYVDLHGWKGSDEGLLSLLDKVPFMETLCLPDHFNTPLPATVLSRIKRLEMGDDYNQPFPGDVDLTKLEVLILGSHYKQPFQIAMPNLHMFIMGAWYNQPIPPSCNLKSLRVWEMGYRFNQNIDPNLNLEFLEILRMGESFEQDLNRLNLPNLKVIKMGLLFNHLLPTTSPNLTEIKMDYSFNQSLEGLDLRKLEKLFIGFSYTHTIPEHLPSLRVLKSDLDDLNIPRRLQEQLAKTANPSVLGKREPLAGRESLPAKGSRKH